MQLQVWRTTKDIIAFCWQERATAVRFSIVPFIVIVASSWIGEAMGIDPARPSPAVAVLGIVQLLVYLPVTVAWYRFVVMGPEGTAQRPLFTLGAREWRLLG